MHGKKTLAEYKLYLGDCLDYTKSMSEKNVDVIITDPPYGMGKYSTDIEFDYSLISLWRKKYQSVAIFGFPELLVKWCVLHQP